MHLDSSDSNKNVSVGSSKGPSLYKSTGKINVKINFSNVWKIIKGL